MDGSTRLRLEGKWDRIKGKVKETWGRSPTTTWTGPRATGTSFINGLGQFGEIRVAAR